MDLEPLLGRMLPGSLALLYPGQVLGQRSCKGHRELWPGAFGQQAWKCWVDQKVRSDFSLDVRDQMNEHFGQHNILAVWGGMLRPLRVSLGDSPITGVSVEYSHIHQLAGEWMGADDYKGKP